MSNLKQHNDINFTETNTIETRCTRSTSCIDNCKCPKSSGQYSEDRPALKSSEEIPVDEAEQVHSFDSYDGLMTDLENNPI